MIERWNHFWFRPEPRINLVAARVLLVANSLWILLSRPWLPDLISWPRGFWSQIDPAILRRFFIFPIGGGAEWALYAALLVLLLAAAFGAGGRLVCFAAAILLYHFAPFEDILSSDGPYFRGFSVPVIGLLCLSFARDPRTDADPEHRWPLMLIRLHFAFTYFFSGIAKIFVPTIPTWISKQHFLLIVSGRSSPDAIAPWGEFYFRHPELAAITAALVLLLDFTIIVTVFYPRAAWFFVPAAMAMHLLSPYIVGVYFLNAPLLFLFIDWEAVRRRWQHRRIGYNRAHA